MADTLDEIIEQNLNKLDLELPNEGSSCVDLYDVLLRKGNALKANIYNIKILDHHVEGSLAFNIHAKSTESDSMRLYRVAIQRVKDKNCYCEALMYSSVSQKMNIGNSYRVEGCLFLINHGSVPLLGYYKKGSGFLPPRKQGQMPNMEYDNYAPEYRIPTMPTLQDDEFYEENFGVKLKPNRLIVKNFYSLKAVSGLVVQDSFKTLMKYVAAPGVQIVNGNGRVDEVSKKLLNYLVGDHWEKFETITELKNKDIRSYLGVRFVSKPSELYNILPAVDIRN